MMLDTFTPCLGVLGVLGLGYLFCRALGEVGLLCNFLVLFRDALEWAARLFPP